MNEITADRDVVNHIERKWNEARSNWKDAQATEFYDKCIYTLETQVEHMGRDARDAVRVADVVQKKIDQISRSQWS